jgi:hypothetical protein
MSAGTIPGALLGHLRHRSRHHELSHRRLRRGRRRLTQEPLGPSDADLGARRTAFLTNLAELNGYLLRDRRGAEAVGYMMQLARTHRDPGILQGIEIGSACALDGLWRQVPRH